MKKNIIIGKRIECVLGIFFLLPAIYSVIAFFMNLWNFNTAFDAMYELDHVWSGEAFDPAILYIGLMAIAGALLIKDSVQYLFKDKESQDKVE